MVACFFLRLCVFFVTDLVVRPDFAVVTRGALVLVEHFTLGNFTVHDPMVVRLHTRRHATLHVRDGVGEDGRAAVGGRPLNAFETIGAGRETREKVLHDGLVPVFWKTVQHERVVHLHEGFDGAILGDGDGET